MKSKNRKLILKKCLKKGWLICHWPDGFVEYEVRIRKNLSSNTQQGMLDKLSGNMWEERVVTFTKDIPEENKRISCDVSLQNQSTHDDLFGGESFYLDVTCDTYKYDEYYAWRNQEVEDTLAGKYDIVSVEKQPTGSPFGKKIYGVRMNEAPEEWKSNTKKYLKKHDAEISSNGMMTKMMAGMGIDKEVNADNSDSAIADMIIKGVSTGSVDMEKKLKQYRDEADEKELKLAEDFLKFQEKTIDILKEYL